MNSSKLKTLAVVAVLIAFAAIVVWQQVRIARYQREIAVAHREGKMEGEARHLMDQRRCAMTMSEIAMIEKQYIDVLAATLHVPDDISTKSLRPGVPADQYQEASDDPTMKPYLPYFLFKANYDRMQASAREWNR
jgi:hypothetical protein